MDTPEQLLEELVKGTTHIVITKHLNFTAARTGNAGDSDDPVLDIPDVVRSIQVCSSVLYLEIQLGTHRPNNLAISGSMV